MKLRHADLSADKLSLRRRGLKHWALATVSLAALVPVFAAAQQAPAPASGKAFTLQDVVITARHRDERAQTVPISLTALNSSQIHNIGSLNLDKIKQLVPSLTINGYNPRNTGLNIRSIGSVGFFGYDGLEGGVGTYVDGVFLGRPTSDDFDIPDLQSIEVLRGPQGTLFGKNTVAGAVVIHTKLPSLTPQSDFSASYGNYNYWQLLGYTTGALGSSNNAAFSLSVHATQQNGFMKNTVTAQRYQNTDDKGIRTQVLLFPNDRLTVRIIANYDHSDSNCCVNSPLGVVTNYANGQPVSPSIFNRYAAVGYTLPPIGPFARQTDTNGWTHYAMETGGLSVQADYDLGGFTLSSITAGSYYNFYPHLDGDSVGIPVYTQANQTTFQRQFSQELRITSPSGGKIDYTAGLFGFYQQINDQAVYSYGPDAAGLFQDTTKTPLAAIENVALNGFSSVQTDIPSTYSYAAYGQATYHITPRLDFTGGARVTYEDKTGLFYGGHTGGVSTATLPAAEAPTVNALRNAFGPNVSYTLATFNLLPGGLATLSYKPTSNILSYATYSYGEKSAGLNFVTVTTIPAIVKPESVSNYEIGAKTTLLGGNFLLNGDLFIEQDNNYQSTVFEPVGAAGKLTAFLANVKAVRSQGLEIDSKLAVTSQLSLFLSGVYDEAYYQSNRSAACPFEVSNVTAVCDLTGRPLAGSSKWTGTIGGDYEHPLPPIQGHDTVAYLGGDIQLRTGFYSTADDSKYGLVPGYALGNITFGVRTADSRWDLSGWVHNFTNAHYYVYRMVTGTLPDYNLVAGSVAPPLTFGVTLAARF